MAISSTIRWTLNAAVSDARAAPTRDKPALLDRTAWRDALLVWLGQRALFAFLAYFSAVLLVAPAATPHYASWSDVFVRPWLSWDSAIFGGIARHGYVDLYESAFYPLFPLLEHLLAPLTGGRTDVAGEVIANLACLPAFGLLRVLAEREMNRGAARRTLLYLAVFPTAFYFSAAYSESLFLLVSVGAFVALRRGQWWIAGALAALATLTRPVGILLVVPMAAEYAQRLIAARRPQAAPGGETDQAVQAVQAGRPPRRLAELAGLAGGLALPVLALLGYWGYLATRFGSPLVALRAESVVDTGRQMTLPVVGFARAAHALLDYGFNPNFYQAHILLDAGFTLAFIALSVVMFIRLPLPFALYTAANLVLELCTPGHNWYALSSYMRFMLVAFPLFMLFGQWGERRWADRVILGISLPLLALLSVTFLLGGWVA